MFGQNKPFGSSTFGGSTGGSSLFGNTQNKPSIFGQTNQQQPQQQNTGSLFGSNQPKPAGSSLFGNTQQQQQQSPSMFGSTSQSTGGSLFGNTSNANKPSSLFGGNTNTSTGGSLFGASNNNPSGSGGLFGSSNTAGAGSSMFGSSGTTVSGTTVKFEPPIGSDTMVRNGSTQNISTKHICITAMNKYEGKSVEELRIEDYMANRKTPSTTTGGGGLFGSTNTANTASTSGGLFGNSGTPQKSIFGNATNSSFGGNTSQGGSLFGNTAAANTNQGSSLFGSKPATTGGSLFGSSTPSSTFGQPAAGGSLFGNSQPQQQSGGLFGQSQPQQQQSGSLFGNTTTTNTGGGLFGNTAQPAQGTGFNFGGGSTTTNAFGQPAANTGGGLFGSANTSGTGGSLFGAKPATTGAFGGFGAAAAPAATNAFGQPAANTSGGLFGNTGAKPGGLFGNTTTTGTTGGLFGSQPAATGGGLFGNTAQPAQTLGFGQAAQPLATAQPQVLQVPVIGVTADVLQMQANMKLLQSQLVQAPYGDSSLLKYVTSPKREDGSEATASAQRQLRFLAAKKSSENAEKSSFITAPISKVMSDLSPAVSKQSPGITKDLNYTSRETPPTLGKGLRSNTTYTTSAPNKDASIVNKTIDSVLDASLNGSTNRLGVRGSVRKSNLKQLDMSVLADMSRYSQNNSYANDTDALPVLKDANNQSKTVQSPENHPAEAVAQRNQDRQQQPPVLNLDNTVNTTIDQLSTASANPSNTSVTSSASVEKSVAGVKLTKPDYYTIPSMTEMQKMVKNGRIVIENGLTIGRSSYGSVFWAGKIELKDIALDEVVVFRHREVTVYPNEEEKPEEGEELNRPAEVTLERVWFTDKKTKKEIRDVVKLAEIGWREHLERQTIRMGATFKDYRGETGSWVFRVEHFSKYGLADDDEPMDTAPPAQKQAAAPLQAIDLNSSIEDVQNKVQRQKIGKNQANAKNNRMDRHEFTIEVSRVPPAEPLSVATNMLSRGLGGGLRIDEDEYRIVNQSSIEYQDEEEGQQPEKKPKLEILADLDYESSRYLKAMKDVKVMPTCVDAKSRFDGGFDETKIIGYGKSKMIDMSISKGRNCPVGWSSLNSMVCSAQPQDNQILWCTIDRSSDVADENVIRSMIDTNVQCCESSRKGASTNNENLNSSLFSNYVTYSNNYSELIQKYISISKAGGFDAHLSVWKLCSALFPQSKEEGWIFERGEQVGDWLRSEASKHSQKLATSKSSPHALVWQQLTVGNVEKAFEIASKQNLIHLAASLYSSVVCPEATIHSYRHQIDLWEKDESLHLIDPNVLKCYLVLSGVSHKQWSFNGRQHSINCLENLHWTQALGVHVWYLRGWQGLEEAYSGYLHDVREKRAQSNRGDLYGELIKLCCEKQHSMEVVLDCAAGEAPHDYYLMWHVWSVLYSVGYRTMSKIVETRLHRCYSSQLEQNVRLAKFAVFVLQHIEDDDERAIAVKSLLERISHFNDDALLDTVSRDFDVPKQWIADAQFVVAKSKGNISELFELAVQSENLAEVQRFFVDEIAPNAVVSGDLESLRIACRMIEHLEDSIPEWGANGKIFVDYCSLMLLIANDKDGGDELEEVLMSIEDRLHAPNFKNTVQKLSLQTIARQLFEYRKHQQIDDEPDWIKMLGNRQLHKIFRDTQLLQVDRYTIEFD